jgi:hypothetical protein
VQLRLSGLSDRHPHRRARAWTRRHSSDGWQGTAEGRLVVLVGGEPLLRKDLSACSPSSAPPAAFPAS